jgi:predicted amidohydrolase
MITNNLKISLIQTDLIWENPKLNRDKFTMLLKQLTGTTDIAILPEMFTTGFSMKPEHLAEPANGKTLEWMQKNANDFGFAICGSVMVKENDLYYNRFYFVEPNGKFHTYNKRHLFRMMDEHNHYQMGTERVIVNYLGWRIMPQICYDLRFPVWSRNQNDYDLLIYVANFPEARQMAWNKLLPARAIENLCYVAGVNRIGTDGNGIPFSGDSQVIDPKGQIVLETENSKETVATISLSLKELYDFRAKFPAHLDADGFTLKT